MSHLIIIGAGPGGYEAALYASERAKGHGIPLTVTLIESGEVGGTCLNRGCIPTKALLRAAHVYHEAKEGERLGVIAPSLSFDVGAAVVRKNAVVTALREGIEKRLAAAKVTLIRGKGRVISASEVEVKTADGVRTLAYDDVIVATGSRPFVPPIDGIAAVGAMTSDELLSCDKPLSSLAIIGGGVIGIEFAGYYNSIGTDVTVIEAQERILPTLDKELSQSVSMSLKKRGVKFFTDATVTKTARNGEILTTFSTKDGESSISSEALLVAIGRRPNTAGVLPPEVQTERGYVVTDGDYQTSVPHIYAIGDIVVGGVQLAHAATAEGFAAVDTILGLPRSIDTALVPACIFTYPEIATVGVTADEAKAAGIAVRAIKYLMGQNGKTALTTDERGFIKLVVRESDVTLIGAQLYCVNATDMINELSLAISLGLTAERVAAVIHPHPTFGEAVREACASKK